MDRSEIHHMDAELINERQTMRYSCRICHRTIEDGPEGVTIVHQGDPTFAHRGGRLDVSHEEFEQHTPAKPVLH